MLIERSLARRFLALALAPVVLLEDVGNSKRFPTLQVSWRGCVNHPLRKIDIFSPINNLTRSVIVLGASRGRSKRRNQGRNQRRGLSHRRSLKTRSQRKRICRRFRRKLNEVEIFRV